jgi:hypothetical protein
MVPPVKSGMVMLDLALTSCCRGGGGGLFFSGDDDVIFTDAESDDGIVIGDASLYLEPDNVVTIFFSIAPPGSTSGLVTIASPSGIVG